MDFGVNLPLIDFQQEGFSRERFQGATRDAEQAGFAALAANDHFLYASPWLDGPTALAASIGDSGRMELATTIVLGALRGPVPLAKSLAAVDLLSGGRLVAGIGPGSSDRDWDALGVPYEERWKRLDESIEMVRSLLCGEVPEPGRFFAAPDEPLAPAPERPGGIPLWIGSWGSAAGLRRVARLADGWLASAYNTTPGGFAQARLRLEEELAERGRDPAGFPNALATMWTWVSEDAAEADQVRAELLAPMLRRDPDELHGKICVGSPAECAEILSAYAEAGCGRVYFWPLGRERTQIDRLAELVLPQVAT